MRRLPFYEVPLATWLFHARGIVPTDKKEREEPIRQWCAFELVRGYGIPITDIRFEHAVKVGSKTYEIDILVMKNNAPWAVIECKEPGYRKAQDAIGQAISYADALSIQAGFVIYTNGQEWIARRKANGKWIPIVDIPSIEPGDGKKSVVSLLSSLEAVMPLLYMLGQPMEGKTAIKFLSHLQVFFNGSNLFTQDVDDCLRDAIDNALRVIGYTGNHVAYEKGKLNNAWRGLTVFRLERRLGPHVHFDPATGNDSYQKLRWLHNYVLAMTPLSSDILCQDALALRLCATILEVGVDIYETKRPVIQITPSLHQALREFLDYVLSANIGYALPDPVDRIDVESLRNHCQEVWKKAD